MARVRGRVSATRRRRPFVSRAFPALVILALAAGLGAESRAAVLAEVRLGRHPGFTRVVFELDEPSGYRLERPREGGAPQVRVILEAESPPRIVEGRGDLVRSVEVKPAGERSEAVVTLATGNVHVTEMILTAPPRLVLDLQRLESGGAETPRRETAGAASESAPETGPEEPSATVRERSTPEASLAGETAVPPREEARPGATAAPEREAPERAGEKASTAQRAAAGEEGAAKPETRATGAGEPSARAPEVAAPGSESTTPAPTRSPSGAAEGRSEPPAASSGPAGAESSDALRRRIGLLLIILGIGILVAVWLRLRARSPTDAVIEDEPVEPLTITARAEEAEAWAPEAAAPAGTEGQAAGAERADRPEETPGAGGAVPGTDKTGTGAREAEPGMAEPHDRSAGSGAFGEAPPVIPLGGPAPAEPPGPPPPPAAAPPAAGADGARVEERLEALEGRLENLLDAVDRLERQVSAQTEELRVQRAAIARTQRVVRSLARPEPLATEPVPRSGDRRPE